MQRKSVEIYTNGNLPTVWEEENQLLPLNKENIKKYRRILSGGIQKTTEYRRVNDIDYNGYKLNWIESIEKIKTEEEKGTTKKRFVHISSIKSDKESAAEISFTGRLRWKIENEGFNEQKNNGYELEHKYSEVSLRASKNYYQSMQIVAIINQLLVKGQKLKRYLRRKITIKHL